MSALAIDVLICVHSQDDLHDRLLGRALESLVRQTYDEFSVIIVLDECWEYTKDIVGHYEGVLDIYRYERPHKQRLAIAKNFGLKRCTGDWVAFLDADDMWDDTKLEKQVEYIQSNDVDVLGTQAWDVYNPGEENEEVRPNCFEIGQYETHSQIGSKLAQENILAHPSLIIRREVLTDIGGYVEDSQYLGKEDWITWIRLFNSGCKFYNIPERLLFYSMGTSVPR
jgi:glycosyltransferase involved in cell wall biosynthesis